MMGLLHCSDPRENLANDVALRHFAFDIRKSTVTEGLNLELYFVRQCHVDIGLEVTLPS